MPAPFSSTYPLKLPTDLERALLSVRHLPTLPSVALRLIELAQEPETDLTRLADTVALDMALSARLLRMANSPLHASNRRIDRLSQALTLLGVHASVQLALDFCLPETKDGPYNKNNALQQRVWLRSLLASQAARLLGQACGEMRSEELGLAGLLQDIGILAWLQIEPERYTSLFHLTAENSTLLQDEREHWGISHADLGARLCAQWDFPPYLVQAIAHSENIEHVNNTFEYCVVLSGLAADLLLADEYMSKTARRYLLTQLQEGLSIGLELDEADCEQIIVSLEEMVPDARHLCAMTLPPLSSDLHAQADALRRLRDLRQLHDLSVGCCCHNKNDNPHLMPRTTTGLMHPRLELMPHTHQKLL